MFGLMNYYGFMFKSLKIEWHPNITNLSPCDVGEFMKDRYSKIILVVIELIESYYY